ncbi:MAG: two-component system response regulator [Elusimicrobia bacterium CG11_big_fil_rev_8_21_14_0_20_64_6]|nr:MAG: two-component system response regulator [Elusimicrobia bacterium CG11_big_fil_rev_8_21_14_0_20_64_6]
MPRILSIEDDVDLQQVFAYVLTKKGWTVTYAYDGKDGLQKALELKPDLILLDMMLPGLNGIEVIKALKENEATRETPVLVMTAYPGDEQFLKASVLAMGAVEYLAKPVHVDTLVKTVERLLSR